MTWNDFRTSTRLGFPLGDGEKKGEHGAFDPLNRLQSFPLSLETKLFLDRIDRLSRLSLLSFKPSRDYCIISLARSPPRRFPFLVSRGCCGDNALVSLP